jgi:hypothetical protein
VSSGGSNDGTVQVLVIKQRDIDWAPKSRQFSSLAGRLASHDTGFNITSMGVPSTG